MNFVIPRSRTNLYGNSFIPLATREWNSLSEDKKSCTSLTTFKHLLDFDKINVPKYFYIGERMAQILHTLLRLGCSSLNADLFNNHVSDTDKCLCGLPETAKHFILYCPYYTQLRHLTIHSISVAIDVDILLKGCPLYSEQVNGEIFNVVQNFIIRSNRFWWKQTSGSTSKLFSSKPYLTLVDYK